MRDQRDSEICNEEGYDWTEVQEFFSQESSRAVMKKDKGGT